MTTPGDERTPHPSHRLLFVRHSVPHQTPDLPAREWRLSDTGRQRAETLARHVASISPPAILATSNEPKARETAAILGAALGLDARVVADLREHDRTGVAYLKGEDFADAIARFFAHPEEQVFGAESAAEAAQRFTSAVNGLIDAAPPGDILLVTHGTVLTLFVAAATGVDALTFWQRLPLPALVVLTPQLRDVASDSTGALWRLDALWPPDGWDGTAAENAPRTGL